VVAAARVVRTRECRVPYLSGGFLDTRVAAERLADPRDRAVRPRDDLSPRRPHHGLAGALEFPLAPGVSGAGEQVVVKPRAVGFQDHALLRPAEVRHVAEVGAVDRGRREPGLVQDREHDVLELVAGGRGRRQQRAQPLRAAVAGRDEVGVPDVALVERFVDRAAQGLERFRTRQIDDGPPR